MKQFTMTSLQAVVMATLLCYVTAKLTVSRSVCKLDLVLCLDNTGSIGYLADGSEDPANPPTNWNLVKDFSQDLVKQLSISPTDSQVGLVDFGQEARIQFGLNDYPTQDEVLDHIASVEYIGDTTNTTGGLYKSRVVLTDPKYGSRDGVSKVIVLITDGNPNVDEDKVYEEAQNCRDAGIRVIVVGITSFINEDLGKKLAYTEDNYVYAEDFSDLEKVQLLVFDDETCKPVKPPTTTPEPTTTPTTTPEPTTITTTTQVTTTTAEITTTKPLPIC